MSAGPLHGHHASQRRTAGGHLRVGPKRARPPARRVASDGGPAPPTSAGVHGCLRQRRLPRADRPLPRPPSRICRDYPRPAPGPTTSGGYARRPGPESGSPTPAPIGSGAVRATCGGRRQTRNSLCCRRAGRSRVEAFPYWAARLSRRRGGKSSGSTALRRVDDTPVVKRRLQGSRRVRCPTVFTRDWSPPRGPRRGSRKDLSPRRMPPLIVLICTCCCVQV